MACAKKAKAWLRIVGWMMPALGLVACTSAPPRNPLTLHVDRSLQSPNQDATQKILVLHYTAAPTAKALELLTDPARSVSAHYVVPDSASPSARHYSIYQLVSEHRRAWHAGVSHWQGYRLINSASIGIEIVNLGFPADQEQRPLMRRDWFPYADDQIRAVGQLAKEIVDRYGIEPTRVVGHSDVAPGRKFDPGPRFPWERLYRDYGVGAWYDQEAVNYYRTQAAWDGCATEVQKKLARFGYEIDVSGRLDEATKRVVAAFQMHFYPARYDGELDVETVARLDALLEKYFGQKRPVPALK